MIRDTIDALPPDRPGQSLYLFAYIGNGRMEADQLCMCSRSGKNVVWDSVKQDFFCDNGALEHIDALAFFDCCYAGGARSGSTRNLEILAATGKTKQQGRAEQA